MFKNLPPTYLCFVLVFLSYQLSVCYTFNITSEEASTSRDSGPPCVTYRPNIPLSFSNGGNCFRENGFGVPNPNVLTTLDEITLRGYYVSTHTVVSKDGYTSALYRISGGEKSPPKRGKLSVLLFHGGGGGSASWIIQPGSRNLAFLLVDNGYEVWLANARGTSPSKNHTRLNADTDIEYWEFSFEEIGTRDLPLMADLMRWTTGTEKVYYVCHSVGCALYLAGLAQVPELSSRFKAGFPLAPGAFLGSGSNPFIQLLTTILNGKPLLQDTIFRLLGGRVSGEPNALLSALGLSPDRLCSWTALRCGVCDNAIFAFYGADAPQLNYTEFPNILRKLADNLGLRVFFHGLQNFPTCEFLRYDYGEKPNILIYGSKRPPPYNMENVRVPTYVFVGESDNLVAPTDGERLYNNISPKYRLGFHRVNWQLFNHPDFLMANDADVLVYNRILDTINKIESHYHSHRHQSHQRHQRDNQEHHQRGHQAHHYDNSDYDYDNYGWR